MNSLRRLHASRFANLDFWIAGVLQQGRQPAEFELGPAIDQHIGVAQRNDEAWTRIDEMRIFGRFSENYDVDLVSANFARKRAKIGKGGNDIELGLRCESAGKDCEQN